MKGPDPSILKSIKNFRPSSQSKFGRDMSPIMAKCIYKNGRWDEPKLTACAPLSLMPNCKVFHYGQEIFEGMKAYYVDKQGPFLFRPRDNYKRFNLSAARMAMPQIPEDVFIDAVSKVTSYSTSLIPQITGNSLYIRPIMFATEESLGINPPNEFLFLVMAAPFGDYFQGKSLKLWVEREFVRACPGGVGMAKTGGNYAAALKSSVDTVKRGLDQPLWLDALTRENVEEMSGMNFFYFKGGILYTPKLTDSILDGITRRSLIYLSPVEVKECTIKIKELLDSIATGECTEAFACGTAVLVTPLASLTDGEKTYTFQHAFGPITRSLRTHLLDIQEGRKEGPSDWVYKVRLPRR